MEKFFIQNRKGQKLAVIIDETKGAKELVFVMHGLGGFKEQKHVETFANTFKKHNFTVVRFDTTNTLGESDGSYEDATVTNYFEDLEDVITWASVQKWYVEPFWLCGHSLGGISTALYAQKYPSKVKALAPISTVVSGQLSLDFLKETKPNELSEWTQSGWRISPSLSKVGVVKKLKWNSHIADRMQYDLLKSAKKLIMPVLLIVGTEDDSTPLKHQEILYEKLPGDKELHVIKNAPHTFKEKEHLDKIRVIFDKWISKVLKLK